MHGILSADNRRVLSLTSLQSESFKKQLITYYLEQNDHISKDIDIKKENQFFALTLSRLHLLLHSVKNLKLLWRTVHTYFLSPDLAPMWSPRRGPALQHLLQPHPGAQLLAILLHAGQLQPWLEGQLQLQLKQEGGQLQLQLHQEEQVKHQLQLEQEGQLQLQLQQEGQLKLKLQFQCPEYLDKAGRGRVWCGAPARRTSPTSSTSTRCSSHRGRGWTSWASSSPTSGTPRCP